MLAIEVQMVSRTLVYSFMHATLKLIRQIIFISDSMTCMTYSTLMHWMLACSGVSHCKFLDTRVSLISTIMFKLTTCFFM
jgi:hypothetical protein